MVRGGEAADRRGELCRLAPGLGDGAATPRISPSLLFAWRKVYRAGTLVDAEPGSFVPAVVVDERPAPAPAPSRIEIVTPNGYRVLAGADVDEAALVRVLAVLARA